MMMHVLLRLVIVAKCYRELYYYTKRLTTKMFEMIEDNIRETFDGVAMFKTHFYSRKQLLFSYNYELFK